MKTNFVPRMSSLILLLWVAPNLFADATWEGKSSQWRGFERYDFELDGLRCHVVLPEAPAKGRPWVWRARFPSYHVEPDLLLLEQGFHIAHIDTGGMLGSPKALEYWDAFYDLMTGKHGMSRKPALVAVSRGGLFAYRWAALNPKCVACIYGDVPVCDFRSWPLGQGSGIGHEQTWQNLLREYALTHEQALMYDKNPIDVLAPIAEQKIPLLHLVSLNDRIVPADENTFVLAKRYRKLGGSIAIVAVKDGTKESNGHHFEHPDPNRVADFIQKHAQQ